MKRILRHTLMAILNFTLHLLLISAHAVILYFIAKIWIDKFELKISPHKIDSQLYIIFVFSCVVVILFLVKRIVQRKKQQNILQRLKISAVLALIVFSWLYFDSTARIISHRILNQNIRAELLDKTFIGNLGRTTFINAKDLSYREYKQFARPLKLAKLNKKAYDITLDCDVTRNLAGEYATEITYYLPKGSNVKVFEYDGERADFDRYQRIEEVGDKMKVTFFKSWW
nr:hypothetical protein [uncultured Draconibacterium sp.]